MLPFALSSDIWTNTIVKIQSNISAKKIQVWFGDQTNERLVLRVGCRKCRLQLDHGQTFRGHFSAVWQNVTTEQDSCKTDSAASLQPVTQKNNSSLFYWDSMHHIKTFIETLSVMRVRQSISSLFIIKNALNHFEYSLKTLWTSEPTELEHVTSLWEKTKQTTSSRDVLSCCTKEDSSNDFRSGHIGYNK